MMRLCFKLKWLGWNKILIESSCLNKGKKTKYISSFYTCRETLCIEDFYFYFYV